MGLCASLARAGVSHQYAALTVPLLGARWNSDRFSRGIAGLDLNTPLIFHLDTFRKNLQNIDFAQALASLFFIPRDTAMVHCRAESKALPRLRHLMKTTLLLRALALVLTLTSTALHAQVPQILNYQGRVAVGSPPVNFDGSGAFKFALVDAVGTTSYWSNDGTSTAGSQPTAAVTLPVTKGLYSVLLGANMTPIPNAVFANPDVRLRVWFDDGTNGSQLLTPDQRIAAVGYAMLANTVTDGAITTAKLAPGAVTSANLAANLTLAGTTTGTFSGDGSELTNLSVPTASHYLFGYHAGTAAVLGPTFVDILLSNPLAEGGGWGGWTYTSNRYKVPASGVYLIRYGGLISGASGTRTASFRATRNGVEILGSQSAGTATTLPSTLSHDFISSLEANDLLTFQFASEGTSVVLLTQAGVGDPRTSFSCTIIRLK